MQLDILHMLTEAPLPVQIVVLVLTAQALLSLAVILDRVMLLAISKRRAKEFAQAADDPIDAGNLVGALQHASDKGGNHLASLMYVGLRTFLDRRDEGKSVDKSLHLTERALERKQEQVSADLNRGMNVLASTGSTAPFVGLLGTVLGILFTFQKIASEGGGGIATIGGEIGEALVVTGLGLVVAIPVVLVYNALSNRIALYEAALGNGCSELIDRLNGLDETEDYGTVEVPAAVTDSVQREAAPENDTISAERAVA